MSDQSKLEEQALEKIAEMTLSNQLDAAEKIDVDVRTDVLKIVQGQADSVAIAGQGLVMQKDIRVEQMELRADHIAINPLSALFGQIELDQPLNATARLVLTETDINRALNSEYMQSKMQKLELNVEGKIATIEPLKLELYLPANDKIVFHANTILHDETSKTQHIGFTGTMLVNSGDRSLLMEGFNCTPDQGISLELAITFMQKLKQLLNLPDFELAGMALRVKDVDVQQGSLILHTEARVQQIPV